MRDLYNDYVQKCTADTLKASSFSTFYSIFKGEINISFFTPKKDHCEVCEAFKNSNAKEKVILKDSIELHQREKDISRKEIKMIQRIRMSSLLFSTYKQLGNCRSMNSDRYVWDESHAKRGANEIGSCVFHYISRLVATKPNQYFILYTDNCAGQQQKSISCCVVHLYDTDNGHIIDYAQVFD